MAFKPLQDYLKLFLGQVSKHHIDLQQGMALTL
jgi:hypothetical protein